MIGVGGNDKPTCILDIFMEPNSTNYQIRSAKPRDAQSIYDLIVALAIYEKEPQAVETTPHIICEQMSDPNPPFQCLVAEVEDIIVGFALYFFNYSTWKGQRGIYLEDLFVEPKFRQQGIALALMQSLAEIAQKEQCGRIDWSVLRWNQLAINFYKNIGASEMHEWIGYRIEGNDIFTLCQKNRM